MLLNEALEEPNADVADQCFDNSCRVCVHARLST